jgi:hypothetical protein
MNPFAIARPRKPFGSASKLPDYDLERLFQREADRFCATPAFQVTLRAGVAARVGQKRVTGQLAAHLREAGPPCLVAYSVGLNSLLPSQPAA